MSRPAALLAVAAMATAAAVLIGAGAPIVPVLITALVAFLAITAAATR